jgi:hypothetical protein
VTAQSGADLDRIQHCYVTPANERRRQGQRSVTIALPIGVANGISPLVTDVVNAMAADEWGVQHLAATSAHVVILFHAYQ